MGMIKSFHQFVYIEKGPVNSAIIDFLKGNVYQAENSIIEKVLDVKYQENSRESIRFLHAEELIIEHDSQRWIPRVELKKIEINEDAYELDIEDGVDLKSVVKLIEQEKTVNINVYGNKSYGQSILGIKVTPRKKCFDKCLQMSTVDGEFGKISMTAYRINMEYNSCWGRKIAVCKDGMIRPCLYSGISIGEIGKNDMESVILEAEKFWRLTKDKIEICKDCEFRYLCFDCREIARRANNNIYSKNPNCRYNPNKGEFV